MAERSVNATLNNNSNYTLSLATINITNGKSTLSAPKLISPVQQGKWATENAEPMTGTSGNLTYTGVGPSGNFSVYCQWNNPFIGDDQFSCSTTLPEGTITYSTGRGNNAEVIFTFS